MSSLSFKKISPIDFYSKSIWILGKVAIFFAVGLAISARQKLNEYNRIMPVQIEKPSEINSASDITANSQEKLMLIQKRDLFATIKSEKKEEVKEPKKKSELGFRLVGTSITKGKTPFAIIENSQKKQDVFEIEEKVFQKASLKEIHTEKIVLERDGTLEVLEVEGGIKDPSDSNITSSGGEFVIPEEELTEALNNLPTLLSQARAVPYFRNGQSIGMRLYAIKSGSLYEKIGLKNSDVIKEINNSQVNDPSKALKLFEDLKTERSISVAVEREGQDIQLRYQIR
jgi:type II secretion system protein C